LSHFSAAEENSPAHTWLNDHTWQTPFHAAQGEERSSHTSLGWDTSQNWQDP